MSAEEWRPIAGYEGIYEISNLGRVRSLERTTSDGRRIRGRVLAQGANLNGYMQVQLWRDGVRRAPLVHRLVLMAFVGPPPEGTEGCHNDGDALNNAINNLRWDTHSANERDRVRHGTHTNAAKTHCPRAHEYTPENTYLRGGSRFCRACQAIHNDGAQRRRAQKTKAGNI